MRKKFPGYYRPTKDEFAKLWTECVFAFDANVLLNLYRYSPSTRDDFVALLRKLRNRIWLPYQAASEYQENRLTVIASQESAYEHLAKLLKRVSADVEEGFRGQYPRHALIEVDKVVAGLKKAAETALKAIGEARKTHPKYDLEKDSIRDALTDLFDESHVGDADAPPDARRMAKVRFEQNRPPGIKDKGKGEQEQYGDAVLWLQLLEHARKVQKAIVFVTDDRKSDWWERREGKTTGPLPELVQEMSVSANVSYYQYRPDSFMETALEFLNEKPAKTAVKEVREVARAAEELKSEVIYSRSLAAVQEAVRAARSNPLADALGSQPSLTLSLTQEALKGLRSNPLADALGSQPSLTLSLTQEALKGLRSDPLAELRETLKADLAMELRNTLKANQADLPADLPLASEKKEVQKGATAPEKSTEDPTKTDKGTGSKT